MLKELIVRFDSRLTIAITGWPGWLQIPMLAVTFIGQPVCLVILATVITLGSLHTPAIALALLAALGAMLVNTAIKHFVRRPRPDTLYVSNMVMKSPSFPSGHAFGGVVVFGALAYIAAIHLTVVLAAILVILIICIGLSRVYLGAHYPTDVLAGWVLGGVFLWLIIGVFRP